MVSPTVLTTARALCWLFCGFKPLTEDKGKETSHQAVLGSSRVCLGVPPWGMFRKTSFLPECSAPPRLRQANLAASPSVVMQILNSRASAGDTGAADFVQVGNDSDTGFLTSLGCRSSPEVSMGCTPGKTGAPVARVSGRPLSAAGVYSGEAGTTHPVCHHFCAFAQSGDKGATYIHMHPGLHTLHKHGPPLTFWSLSKLLQVYTLNSNRTSFVMVSLLGLIHPLEYELTKGKGFLF